MLIDFSQQVSVKPQIFNTTFTRGFYQKATPDVFIKNSDPLYEGVKIDKKNFGRISKTGEIAHLYTLTNKSGASVSISTFGATITGIKVRNKDGKLINVTQGYSSVEAYEKYPVGHAGGTIGPCANKISGGVFVINDEKYNLERNKDNEQNHSHGGSEGFDVKNWNAKVLRDGIEFSYLKKDMENGYPGNVLAKVVYKFDNENKLHIQYSAKTDKDTLINMTNHTYFNLDGAINSHEGSVLDHLVTLPNSSKITETDSISIPTGMFVDVKGTPFDFSKPQLISENINIENEQLRFTKGFDQNFCVDNYDGKSLIEVAKVESLKSGIELTVLSNLPGFQFYTANNLGKPNQPCGREGKKYEKRSALCIEPQFYPNAINTENFVEKGILKSDDEYKRDIVYSFSIKK